MSTKVGIIGYGYVGKGMKKIFPDALIYDPGYEEYENEAIKEQINKECELAIICVPTPPQGSLEQKVDNEENRWLEVDISYVENVLDWLEVPLILIKSTIPPGTTAKLIIKYKKSICFSPEFMGESSYYVPSHYLDPTNPLQHPFLIIGGHDSVCDLILEYFKEKFGPAKTYFKCSTIEAECIKYMENTWGAMKVTFMNEWYEICQALGVSFNTVREGFVLDNRVEKMHTLVFKNKRGFNGKCFPKDLLGIINTSLTVGYDPKLLKEIWETNKRMLKLNK